MVSNPIVYIKGPNLNILVCEIYESLHQEGELTWSLSYYPSVRDLFCKFISSMRSGHHLYEGCFDLVQVD